MTLVVQDIGLFLLRAWDEMCNAAGVQYFIEGGTLLGAYRNRTWIPWDDDIDVVIKRDDVHKLIDFQECNQSLFDQWDLTLDDANPDVLRLYLQSVFSPEDKLHLDAFIYNELPNATIIRRISMPILKMLTAFARPHVDTNENRNLSLYGISQQAKRIVRSIPFIRVTALKALLLLPRIANIRSEGHYWALLGDGHIARDGFQTTDLFPVGTIEFCGFSVPRPANPEVLLHHYYGADFMTPIPYPPHYTPPLILGASWSLAQFSALADPRNEVDFSWKAPTQR